MTAVDRSDWVRKCEQNNPEIKELKERLIPLDRAVSFGNHYVDEPASERNKKKARRQDGLLNENSILQLIMQHLEFEGLKESKKMLEKLSKQQYTPHPELPESRLMTILRTILKDTERVWDLTMDDKFTTSSQNFTELTDHLMDLDLLEEEPPTGVEEVNIWDENIFNLILDRDNKSVKAASLNHLTIKLTETSEEEYDPRLLSTFLHTYRTFTTPEKFLQKLKERYQVPPKDPTGDKRDDEWKPLKRTVQIRVVGVLRKWIAEHYDDFRNSDKLMRELEEFVLLIEKDNKALARPLNSALANKENEKVIRKDFGKPAPEPKVVLRTIFSPNLDLMECDEEEVARQLTLIEFDTYASIKPPELLGLAWSKPKLKHRAPNVLKMIDRSTKVSNWVATTILKEEKIRKRSRIMFKFIKILEHLFVLNNFSTSMAIIAGLNMAPVYRLKYTFGEIGNHSQRTLEDLGKKLSSTSAYRTYREILATVNPPCIPYLGTYLTDLTFIEEGNPDWYRGLINFNKRRLIYEVLEKIQRYQQTAYNFIQIPQMQEVLETKNLPFLSEEELHRLSLTIEPRNAERAEIQ